MATSEPLCLITDSHTSSTCTQILRTSDQSVDENLNNDSNLAAGPNVTNDLAVTVDSSPYMRSSPQVHPSEASIYERPPESSSFISPSSSSDSSLYFPAFALRPISYSSGTSSSEKDSFTRNLFDANLPDESAVSSPSRYNLWLPMKSTMSESQASRDEFYQCLYERLLVVKREQERAEKRTNWSKGNNSVSTSSDEGAPFLSIQDSLLIDSFASPRHSGPSSDETDIGALLFASPPRSENITPPKYRKRPRESDADGSIHYGTSRDGKENRIVEQAPCRLIWHAASFEVYQNRRVRSEEWEYDAPPLKRQRTYIYTHRQEYASKPASLRRALSLKSDCESSLDSAASYSDQELTATEPATPIPSNRGSKDEFLIFGVPIIAPPLGHVAAFPISTETVAKVRIHRYLEKEFATREADGLGIPFHLKGDALSLPQSEFWEVRLAIGKSLREDVIDWLLNVLPAESKSLASAGSSSFSSTTSQSSTSSFQVDLYDELSSWPETRFHAVFIFLRFFYCVMSEASDSEQAALTGGTTNLSRTRNANNRSTTIVEQEGKELMIWDTAVGSLALSVKFHRDVLEPLSPIFAHEYLDLAPHRISFDDLETAHRDILFALSYDLGATPQPLLDNLWLALPSLRRLFDYEGGWNYVLRETWLQLFDAISGKLDDAHSAIDCMASLPEPDVLKFPLSTITTTCLTEGIVTALVHKYDYRSTWRKTVLKTKRSSKLSRKTRRKKGIIRKAAEEAEGVIQDIQAVTGVTDARLQECRSWFSMRGSATDEYRISPV